MLEISQSVTEYVGAQAHDLTVALLQSTQPLVLRGLIASWPAVEAATRSADAVAAYIQTFDSGKPLTALVADADAQGRIFYNSDLSGFNFQHRRCTLAEVFEQLAAARTEGAAGTIYLGSTNIDNWLPGFRHHNDLGLAAYQPLASIWIGNQTRIAAHYDFPTNIACCVAGRRRVTLFPPEQLGNLYVGPIDFTPAGQPVSLVDFANPDYDKYPKFRDALASAQVVELAPGDGLLIPSMWWHHIEALDDLNVLVNYWWRDSPAYLGAPLNALQHAILALRDLPEGQRDIWKALFDYYVFTTSDEHLQHIPEQARGVLNPINEEMAQQLRTLLASKIK